MQGDGGVTDLAAFDSALLGRTGMVDEVFRASPFFWESSAQPLPAGETAGPAPKFSVYPEQH